MRQIFLYKKFNENGEAVRAVAEKLVGTDDQIYIVTEHARSTEKLKEAAAKARRGDIIIIATLKDLGNANNSASLLDRFTGDGICLAICDMQSTYTYGVDPDHNSIALQAVKEILSQITDEEYKIHVPQNIGRPEIDFPDGWEQKYQDWKKKKISSGEFIRWSGMKKATFYNKMAQYEQMLESEEKFIREIKSAGWDDRYNVKYRN